MLPLAAALELIHTYSLIHDDLPAMDDDDLRRGRPTCHVRYGEDVAILAGDGALRRGVPAPARCTSRPASRDACSPPRPSWPPPPASTGWSAASTSTSADSSRTATSSLRRLHELKTGRLIGASVECVLLLTSDDAPATRLPDFRAFAAELGVLFQIVDDILDVTGTDDALGKPQGSDERHGKLHLREPVRARRRAPDGRRLARQRPGRRWPAAPGGAAELEQITDFISTRSS